MAGTKRSEAPQQRVYHHGDVPRAAVAAALRLLDRDGAAAVTMTRVAAAVGVTRPALNRHFGDAAGLAEAVAAACLAGLEEAMRTAVRQVDGDAAAFRAVGEAYIAWGRRHPRRYGYLFAVDPAALPLPDVRRILLEDAGEEVPAAFAFASPPGVAAVADAAFMPWAAVHGLTLLLTAGPLADVDEARQDRLVATVLQGVGAAFGMAPPLGMAA